MFLICRCSVAVAVKFIATAMAFGTATADIQNSAVVFAIVSFAATVAVRAAVPPYFMCMCKIPGPALLTGPLHLRGHRPFGGRAVRP